MTPIDFTRVAHDCLSDTGRLLRAHGPRLTGSSACRATAEELAGELRGFSDSVSVDDFPVHPGAFYSYTKILPAVYAAGILVLFLFPRLSLIPACALMLGIALMLFQFAFYRHVGDRLFRRQTGYNVEGIVEPAQPAERELILSGHHDSAPLARIFSSPFQRFYAVAIFLPYVFFIGELLILTARALTGTPGPAGWNLPFLLAGLPFVAGYFFMVALRRGSPGAGDNLVASVMAVKLGKEIAGRKGDLLRTTRLRIVSFDAEEAGLRGAAAYMRRKAASLLPCFHLNFDSLYARDELSVLTSDINGSVPLSRAMVDELFSCAQECGVAMRRFSMIFGAGGTDAAESTRRGIPSTTVIAMPTKVFRGNLVYHTPRDVVEHVEPAVVEACMRITAAFLSRLENAPPP
jgi:aminopeptidase YwaD